MKRVSLTIEGRSGYGAVKGAGVVDRTQRFAASGVTTLRGVGSKRTPPPWLRPGKLVEVGISAIGGLRNPVVAEAAISAAF
jgi:2-keto-4-pentenoate hydratase/2-oxohepta-3-ene-1,7-dioic acid hydratase in catechol pathway